MFNNEVLDVNWCCFYLLSSNAKEYSSTSQLVVFFFGMGEFWSDVSDKKIFYPWTTAIVSFFVSKCTATTGRLSFLRLESVFFGLTLSSVYGILSLWQSFLLLHAHSLYYTSSCFRLYTVAWRRVPICTVPIRFFWDYTFLVQCVPWMIRPLHDAF